MPSNSDTEKDIKDYIKTKFLGFKMETTEEYFII